jgi:hypothetical protein
MTPDVVIGVPSILHHMLKVVASVPPQEDPFPHFWVSGLFPSTVYDELLHSLPRSELYEPFGYDGHGSGGSLQSRARFRFENNSLDRLPAAQRELWHGIRDALATREFKEAVFNKLASGLCRRFGCEREDAGTLPGFPLPELFRETTGYRIKPHPDTKVKVVTMQVCLAADESQSDLGTEFYRPSFSPAALFREPRGFEVVKRMPFLPNSAYAFAVLNTLAVRSWHGRSTLPESAGVRNSLLNFWYLTPDRANKDLLPLEHPSG